MSVAIKKIDGVESVNVSLNQGRASIQLKPGNSLRLEQVDQAVQNNGFTPKEARVKVRGQVSVTDGKPKLRVLETNEVYELVTDSQHAKLSSEIAKQAGKQVVIEERFRRRTRGKARTSFRYSASRREREFSLQTTIANRAGTSRSAVLSYVALFSSLGTLLCCALPSLLVLFGLGTTVAAFLSAVPWLVTLSHRKTWVFAISGILIAGNFVYVHLTTTPGQRAGLLPRHPRTAV